MTLRRTKRSVSDCLYDLATRYPGGFDELCARMGTTPGKLRKRLSPAVSDREPLLSDFHKIVEFCQGVGMDVSEAFDAFGARHSGVFIRDDEAEYTSTECLHKAGSIAMQRLGEATGEFNAAIEDGHINEHELDKIESRFHRAKVALRVWLERIKLRAKKDARVPA